MSWQVKFFQNQRGDFPVIDFIEKLEEPVYTKALRSIRLIRDHGPAIKPPYAKKIRTNLWELCVSSKIQVRVFYFFHNNIFYILHAFVKKSQKTPIREMEIALDRIRKLI